MRFRDLLRLSTSSLFKRKLRTILTVAGVMIGVSSIVVMVSLGLGLSKTLTEEMSNYGSLTSVTVYDASDGYFGMNFGETDNQSADESKHLDDEAIKELSALPNVTAVVPMLLVDVMIKSGAYESINTLYGVPEGYLENQNIKLAQGDYPKENGGMPEVLYGNMIMAQLHNPKTESGYWFDGVMAKVDLMKDPITFILDTQTYFEFQYGAGGEDGAVPQMPKKHIFKTSGVIEGGPDDYNSHCNYIYCNLEDLKKIVKKDFKNKVLPGQPTKPSGKPYKELYYSQLIVMTDSMEHVKDLQTEINSMGYNATSDAEWIAQEQTTMGYIQLVLGGIGAVSLLVAAIGIANTMMMSIYERTKEIGIMKVLGCDMRNIQGMFLLEAGFIGFIGGVAGLVISYLMSGIINFVVQSMAGEMGMEGQLSYIPPWLAILSLGFAVLVGMLAGFFPSLRAMRLSPLAAIRNE